MTVIPSLPSATPDLRLASGDEIDGTGLTETSLAAVMVGTTMEVTITTVIDAMSALRLIMGALRDQRAVSAQGPTLMVQHLSKIIASRALASPAIYDRWRN
jgi:hypothetical protein